MWSMEVQNMRMQDLVTCTSWYSFLLGASTILFPLIYLFILELRMFVLSPFVDKRYKDIQLLIPLMALSQFD